ncbi:MAG: hypothetical protein CSYNP_03163 [Syntrophus sp. SKADARSKE-3]|nr:hypothetical protein [Syntrophus sp. SKADARSKE-3]
MNKPKDKKQISRSGFVTTKLRFTTTFYERKRCSVEIRISRLLKWSDFGDIPVASD